MSTELDIILAPEDLPKAISRKELEKIGNFMIDGLSEDEACILSGYNPGKFKELKQSSDVVAMYIEKKKIEFKRKHLKKIQEKSSDKTSMWLLENLRPEEFGSKKGRPGDELDVIGAIVRSIRKANDTLTVNVRDAEYKMAGGATKKPMTVSKALV